LGNFRPALTKIDATIAELKAQLGGTPAIAEKRGRKPNVATTETAPKPKRKMSAATRRRMAAGQKKRWEKVHAKQKG